MMVDCVFCKIVRGEIPTRARVRTDRVVAFGDLNPQAPSHLLVVPTRHAAHLSEFMARASEAEAAELMRTASDLGLTHGPDGYRIVIKEGEKGGQTVSHLPLHLFAGRQMRWPPG